MKPLLELPTPALLSSSQLIRRLMAVCLSEEDRCFIALPLRTMGHILSSSKHPDFRCSLCSEDGLPRTGIGPVALSPVSERKPWMKHSWPPHQGLPLPLRRCGTVRMSRQGRSIGICGRGFSNRLFPRDV